MVKKKEKEYYEKKNYPYKKIIGKNILIIVN